MRAHRKRDSTRESKIAGKAGGEAPGGESKPTASKSEGTPADELVSLSPLPSLKADDCKDGNRDHEASSSSDVESDDYEYDYTTDSDGQGSTCADSARGKVTDGGRSAG